MANEFTIRISADDKATATLKKIEAAIAGFMAPIEKAQSKAASLGSVGQAGLEKLEAGLNRVGAATRNLVEGLASIIPGLAAISGAVSMAGLAALADRFASVGFNVSQTANLLGTSRQELQAWQIVGKKAHMTAEEVAGGISSMNDAIRGAALGTNSQAATAMITMGVKVQHNKDGTIDYASTRKAVVDAVARQQQASGRRAAAAALGVPLKLAENKNILADLGDAMNSPLQQTDDAIERARQFQERIDALKMSVDAVALAIGGRLAPVLEPVVDSFGKWFDDNKEKIAQSIANAVEKFSKWLQSIDWEAVTGKAEKFYDMIGGMQGILIGMAGLTLAGPIAGLVSIVASLTQISAMLGGATMSAFFGLPGAAIAGAGIAMVAADAAAIAGAGYVGYKLGEYFLNDDRAYHGANPGLRDSSLRGRRTSLLPSGASGGASAADMISYLMGKGWTKEQAAGIVGNLMQESSLSPSASNGSHYGLAQWSSSRQADFKAKYGRDMKGSSEYQQLDFMHYELTEGKEIAAGNALRAQKDAAGAASVFNQMYERPGMFDTSGPKREANAVAASQIQINVTAPQGTRVDAKDQDGKGVPARVNYSMAAEGSMP